MAKILGDGKRVRARTFSELRSPCLFEDKFDNPGMGIDQGNIEGVVGYGRQTFLVPAPRFENFDALNDETLSAIGPRTIVECWNSNV